MHGNKIISMDALNVKTFHSCVYPEGIITYAFGNNGIKDQNEKDCFLSKEELIKSL